MTRPGGKQTWSIRGPTVAELASVSLMSSVMMLAGCGPAQFPGREGFTDSGTESTETTAGPDLPSETETETGEPECVELVNFGNVSIGSLDELLALDGVTRIEGDVEFIGEWGELPEGLAPLRCLEEITGFLYVHDTDVPSFSGLDALRRIGGYFYIGRTFNHATLEALGALRQVGGYLHITENYGLFSTSGTELLVEVGDFVIVDNNPLLQDLYGLSGLAGTESQLRIEANGSLFSLAGLDNIKGTRGDLAIINNPSLADTSSLANVQHVGGNLYWLNNPQVPALGLSSLETVNAGMYINSMSSLGSLDDLYALYGINNHLYIWDSGLSNVDGLANLEYLGGEVWIQENPNLQNVDGLSSLVTAYASVRIDQNPSLVSAAGLDNLQTVAGGLSLWGNANLATMSLGSLQSVGDYFRVGYSSLDSIPPSPLETIGGDMYVHNNDLMVAASGLASLQSLGGDMYFRENPLLEQAAFAQLAQVLGRVIFIEHAKLRNLNGLSSLSLAQGVILRDNVVLNNITGLAGLSSVPGPFKLVHNGGLVDLIGLDGLAQVGGDLEISLNGNLVQISGFNGLNAVGGSVTLSGNDDLPTCIAQDFVDGIGFIGGGSSISGNQADACGG